MVTRFIKDNAEVWDIILDHLKRTSGQRAAAIAYCTELSLLPLRKGDILVCDASHHAISRGQTRAETLRKLIVDRKVRVFSVEGLHAKVVLAGDHAIVGSMNASESSRERLLEAAIVSDDVAVLRVVEDWIEELCQGADGRIGVREVNALCKIDVEPRSGYRPPERKIDANPAKRLANSDDWFYLYCGLSDWTAKFTKQATPILRNLRKASEDQTFKYEALEYAGIPSGMGIGSKFFLGAFPYRSHQPEVYRECLAVEMIPNGIFYKYPANYDVAEWEAFRAKMSKNGYRLRNGRVERCISVGVANEILKVWSDLVAKK